MLDLLNVFYVSILRFARRRKRTINKYLKRKSLSFSSKQKLIRKYREFDQYNLDLIVYPKKQIWIPKKLPSEPPQGVIYTFGPSGYTGRVDSGFCIIPTEWRNVNSYGHFTLSELPLLYLAFSSPAKHIVLPDAIMEAKLSFQVKWLRALKAKFPGKTVTPISKTTCPENPLIPINHDTSSSEHLIGKCPYKHYHHSRATPYLVEIAPKLRDLFPKPDMPEIKKIYINRKKRRLKNELEIQEYVKKQEYAIINPEDYSVDQQIHLFAEATDIIGFHGSGMANVLFCGNHARIVEIVDKDCVHPAYLDGLVVPGRKATWTYYHMLAHMKQLNYFTAESDHYCLDIDILQNAIDRTRDHSQTVNY